MGVSASGGERSEPWLFPFLFPRLIKDPEAE
jgi:hypothetical protein